MEILLSSTNIWQLGNRSPRFYELMDVKDSVVTQGEVEAEIINFFDKLYTKEQYTRFSPRNIDWRSISNQDCLWLEGPFDDEEIWSPLKSLGKNKAPRLDGFTSEFILKYWQQLKGDFHGYLMSFTETATSISVSRKT